MTHGDTGEKWRSAFFDIVQRHENATALKESSLQERLRDWTEHLTAIVVETCAAMGWHATAKGHRLDLLPVSRSEYLALDVVAFAEGDKRWRFPVAVVELENNRKDDRIAYSLWKVLCVRSALRIVFCYRRSAEQGSALISFLRDEVVHAMDLAGRTKLEGETIVVVGSRGDASTFPYGFFKWWELDANTGRFRLL